MSIAGSGDLLHTHSSLSVDPLARERGNYGEVRFASAMSSGRVGGAGKGGVGVGGVDLRGRRGPCALLPPHMLPVLLLLWGSWAAVVGGVPLKGRLPAGQRGTPPHPDLFGGCVYGGSEYWEGAAVATDEQCLNCTCSRGALVCHLRACPPLPQVEGCTAVRKGGHACCPSIVCDEVNNTVGRAIEEMHFGTEPAKNASGCDVEGKRFEEDASVPGIAGRCEECHCSGGKVNCARTPCSPAPAGCTPLFGDECCPSRYDCPGAPSLALLLDIDLGSNVESVLAPPSHEELMSYFGANSTEEIPEAERGGTEDSPTTSTEGDADDTQSAAPTAGGPRLHHGGGDLRKDRHMETSTLEKTAPETSTAEGGGAAVGGGGEGNVTSGGGDQRKPGGEEVKAMNGSSPEEKIVAGEGGGSTTGIKQLLAHALSIAGSEEEGAVAAVDGGQSESTERGAEAVETTTGEQTTDATTPPDSEEGTATEESEAEATTVAGEAGDGEEEEEVASTTPMTTADPPAGAGGALPASEAVTLGGENETTADSADYEGGNGTVTAEGEEQQVEEEETEYPNSAFADNNSTGNETGADADYEQMHNSTSEDNSTAAVDTLLDSSKNVSNVLGAESEGEGTTTAPGGVEDKEGSGNESGEAEEKTVGKIILAEGEVSAEGNLTEAGEVPTPPNSTASTETAEVDHLTTVVSIERKKDMDYEEYDYNEPTLPPSLPNLRIIPFVAADAVLDKDKHKTTEAPIFFDGAPPSLFSPPVETEGGFVPREPPLLDGGLHDVTYKSPIQSDNLPSFQTDIPLTGIAAIELTTTSKPNVQGDFGLQSLVVNGTLGSSVLDSLIPPLDQSQPEKGTHNLLSPIVRPSFLDSKIVAPHPMPGSLTFYNNASHYPPLPTAVPSSASKSQTVPITYSPLPTKIPNYNTFPSSSHKGTAASPFSAVRNTAKRPSPSTPLGVTPATTTNNNNIVLATMTSSPSGGLPYGSQRRPLPSSDRVSVIPLGPTPPRPSPSTSAPYSVGPNLPPPVKPLASPPLPSMMAPSSPPAPKSPSPGVGLLKLAGCNIYGRMYRVGRIISELSGPCLECRCTEVGVQCRPLPC